MSGHDGHEHALDRNGWRYCVTCKRALTERRRAQARSDRAGRNAGHEWTHADIVILEGSFGAVPTAALAQRLGRTVTAVRLKAKRGGLRMRDNAGMTGREVAHLLGVDERLVGRWVERGMLHTTRGYAQGPHHIHRVTERALDAFVAEHAHWLDARRMQPSPWRARVIEQGRWLTTVEVGERTGRHANALSMECLAGRWDARRRGPHWAIHESLVPAIAATAGGVNGVWADPARREATLRHRKALRLGIAQPRPSGAPPGPRRRRPPVAPPRRVAA